MSVVLPDIDSAISPPDESRPTNDVDELQKVRNELSALREKHSQALTLVAQFGTILLDRHKQAEKDREAGLAVVDRLEERIEELENTLELCEKDNEKKGTSDWNERSALMQIETLTYRAGKAEALLKGTITALRHLCDRSYEAPGVPADRQTFYINIRLRHLAKVALDRLVLCNTLKWEPDRDTPDLAQELLYRLDLYSSHDRHLLNGGNTSVHDVSSYTIHINRSLLHERVKVVNDLQELIKNTVTEMKRSKDSAATGVAENPLRDDNAEE